MTRPGWPVALTVAGSDSSGGAGLQADLKTFAALEVYGASVVTAVTSQNTQGVQGIHLVPPEMVARQLAAVLEDLPVAAIKTGMMGAGPQLAAAADVLGRQPAMPLVIDPVIRATSGDSLLAADGLQGYLESLFPLATLVTPNLDEARLLAGLDTMDAVMLARALLGRGARAVLVTGGDGTGETVEDLLMTSTGQRLFRRPRVATTCTHGTGCTLSAAITAALARGRSLEESVTTAVAYVERALQTAWPLGHGHGPVHHMHPWWKDLP